MKTAAALNSGEAWQACQQDFADFQRRLGILEAVADRIPYTWYVYDVIADRCVWSGAGRAGEPLAPEQVAQCDLHPDDADVLADRRERIAQMRDGEAIGTAYRVRAAGEWRWYYVRDSVLARDEHGLPQQVLSFVEDITQRKAGVAPAAREQAGTVSCGQAEHAECAIYQKVLDFVPVGVALLDRDQAGHLLWANRACWRQLGQSQPADAFTADLALQHFGDFFEVYDPAGEPLPPANWPLARALRGEQFYGSEVCLRHRVTGLQWTVTFDGLPFADAAGTRRLALLLLHPAQSPLPTRLYLEPGQWALGIVPAEFKADIGDLTVPRLDLAALAREVQRGTQGPIRPEPDAPDALPGLQIVYVAGPGDSLEPHCPDL